MTILFQRAVTGGRAGPYSGYTNRTVIKASSIAANTGRIRIAIATAGAMTIGDCFIGYWSGDQTTSDGPLTRVTFNGANGAGGNAGDVIVSDFIDGIATGVKPLLISTYFAVAQSIGMASPNSDVIANQFYQGNFSGQQVFNGENDTAGNLYWTLIEDDGGAPTVALPQVQQMALIAVSSEQAPASEGALIQQMAIVSVQLDKDLPFQPEAYNIPGGVWGFPLFIER